MSEQRLIDANALKECAIPCQIHNGALTDLCIPLYQIDNAQTVELTEEQAIDKLHETGWLVKHDKEMTERPKGDTTDSCDMNFFEPEKHMRGDENGKS